MEDTLCREVCGFQLLPRARRQIDDMEILAAALSSRAMQAEEIATLLGYTKSKTRLRITELLRAGALEVTPSPDALTGRVAGAFYRLIKPSLMRLRGREGGAGFCCDGDCQRRAWRGAAGRECDPLVSALFGAT
ncbi:hypothetical protein ACXZ1M_19780 [Duganella sp. PWIR1]